MVAFFADAFTSVSKTSRQPRVSLCTCCLASLLRFSMVAILLSVLSHLCAVLFVLLFFVEKATDSNVPKGGFFGKGLHEHFPYSGQMRGLTADMCKCDSLGGFRVYRPLVSGSLVSVPSEEYNFRMVSVFCLRGSTANQVHETVLEGFGLFPNVFLRGGVTSDPEVPELCPCFCSLLEIWTLFFAPRVSECPLSCGATVDTYHASVFGLLDEFSHTFLSQILRARVPTNVL